MQNEGYPPSRAGSRFGLTVGFATIAAWLFTNRGLLGAIRTGLLLGVSVIVGDYAVWRGIESLRTADFDETEEIQINIDGESTDT